MTEPPAAPALLLLATETGLVTGEPLLAVVVLVVVMLLSSETATGGDLAIPAPLA
jgi:hypothetical protein